jgi:glutathione S-transferase
VGNAHPTDIGYGYRQWHLDLSTKHTFIARESITLADCSFYPTIAYMVHRGLSLDGWPNLSKYALRIGERLSARSSRPEGWDRSSKTNLFQLATIL